MYRIKLIHVSLILLIITTFVFASKPFTSEIPEIPGIRIIPGRSVLVPGIESALAFRFRDGRIVVGQGDRAMWSYDRGNTWQSGPAGPDEKVAIDLGGEIIAIKRNTHRRSDGRYTVNLSRSRDNWKSIRKEEALLDLPGASYTVTGSGGRVDGFLFHHGLIQLDNGDLIATMYGNYEGDSELCAGYPPEVNQRKYRTVVVFSRDGGKTWGNHVLVAYDKMLGRGIPGDHEMIGKSIPPGRASATAVVPAITQEGFREADIIQAPNGDLICVMRTGGRNGETTMLFPTPMYSSRSSDNGRTWSPPAQIADRGVCPNLVVLDNGIIVCTYSRPGNWLIFSDDNGVSWKGAFQFGTTRDYNYIEQVAPNIIQVYHEVRTEQGKEVRGTFFTIEKY